MILNVGYRYIHIVCNHKKHMLVVCCPYNQCLLSLHTLSVGSTDNVCCRYNQFQFFSPYFQGPERTEKSSKFDLDEVLSGKLFENSHDFMGELWETLSGKNSIGEFIFRRNSVVLLDVCYLII